MPWLTTVGTDPWEDEYAIDAFRERLHADERVPRRHAGH
jgi:hypothetical protein